jgi:hypothetical protein
MNITHTARAGGTGPLTLGALRDVVLSIDVPVDAKVNIETYDSQFDGSGWNITITWEDRCLTT